VAGFDHPLLNLERMEMLRRVRLRPRGAAEGSFAGPHKSDYRGTAVEFADYRNYVDGDDIRLVDWKVFARSDKYYVRLYEAERNLLSYLVVDTSGSMDFAGAVRETESKLTYACRLAAALGYLVVSEGDEVGLSLAADTVHRHLPTRSSWIHLAAVVEALGESAAAGSTDLGACLREVYRRISRRGVLIVMSDFLDPSPELWTAVDLFRRSKFDVMLFHIMHPEELELPDVPLARFENPEGEGRFDAEPAVLRELYRERFARFLDTVEAGARTRGCDWFPARTDTDPYLFLKHCFLARGT
jgi:uncharacterized protein (DUF58 family)